MDNNNLLADLLLPNIDKTPEYYESLYPARELCEGARRVFYEKFTSGVMTRSLEAVYTAEAERTRADGKA